MLMRSSEATCAETRNRRFVVGLKDGTYLLPHHPVEVSEEECSYSRYFPSPHWYQDLSLDYVFLSGYY